MANDSHAHQGMENEDSVLRSGRCFSWTGGCCCGRCLPSGMLPHALLLTVPRVVSVVVDAYKVTRTAVDVEEDLKRPSEADVSLLGGGAERSGMQSEYHIFCSTQEKPGTQQVESSHPLPPHLPQPSTQSLRLAGVLVAAVLFGFDVDCCTDVVGGGSHDVVGHREALGRGGFSALSTSL